MFIQIGRCLVTPAVAVVFCVLAIPVLAQSTAAEWRQSDSDSSHTRYLDSRIEPPLKTGWLVPTDSTGGPAVAFGGIVYVLGSHSVSAVRATDGRTIWIRKFADYELYPYLLATKRLLYCTTNEDGRTLYVLHANNGETVGRYPRGDSESGNPLMYYDQDQCIAHASVGLDNTSGLDVFNRQGRLIAHIPRGHDISELDTMGRFGPSGDWFYFQSGGSLVTAQGLRGRLHGSFIIYGFEKDVVADTDSAYVCPNSRVMRLTRHLATVWSTSLPPPKNPEYGFHYRLALSPSMIVYYDSREIYGIDKRTGQIRWKLPIFRSPLAGSGSNVRPLLAGRYIYLIASNKPTALLDRLLCVKLSTGRIIWSRRVGHNIIGMIAHHRSLYLLDESKGWRASNLKGTSPKYTLLRLDSAGR